MRNRFDALLRYLKHEERDRLLVLSLALRLEGEL
jgi:hypothetical protein